MCDAFVDRGALLLRALLNKGFQLVKLRWARAHEFSSGFKRGLCYSIFSFICNVLQMIVCPFVLYLFTTVLAVL